MINKKLEKILSKFASLYVGEPMDKYSKDFVDNYLAVQLDEAYQRGSKVSVSMSMDGSVKGVACYKKRGSNEYTSTDFSIQVNNEYTKKRKAAGTVN